MCWMALNHPLFLSTLSLRRATACLQSCVVGASISIHALLAESDQKRYPAILGSVISIHALLAESDIFLHYGVFYGCIFLSTLSLRRATRYSLRRSASYRHFYPRSPCGERRSGYFRFPRLDVISIHALLAESDMARPAAQT